MDGVILNSEPIHGDAETMILEKLGIPENDQHSIVGTAATDFWKIIVEKFHIDKDPAELVKEQFDYVAQQIEEQRMPANSGLREVLEWAKSRNMKIALASSSDRSLVDRILHILHLEKYFDFTVAGNEVGKRKPDPALYKRVLEECGLHAEEAIAVEDSGTGVESARAAGIFCYGYKNVTSGKQDLSRANVVIEELAEIIM